MSRCCWVSHTNMVVDVGTKCERCVYEMGGKGIRYSVVFM